MPGIPLPCNHPMGSPLGDNGGLLQGMGSREWSKNLGKTKENPFLYVLASMFQKSNKASIVREGYLVPSALHFMSVSKPIRIPVKQNCH